MNPRTDNTPIGTRETPPSPWRHVTTAARILLGLGFFVFGLNGFLNFIPQPPTAMPEAVVAFNNGLIKSGYMMPLIAGTELIVGVLLLINCFVPLALTLIAPVIVNILAFHIFLMPAGLPPGLVLAILEIYLAWSYRQNFRPMLRMRA